RDRLPQHGGPAGSGRAVPPAERTWHQTEENEPQRHRGHRGRPKRRMEELISSFFSVLFLCVLCASVVRSQATAVASLPAAFRSASALSVRSQVNGGSSRPKWPCRAVSR